MCSIFNDKSQSKNMSSNLTVEFFATFHRRFELPKTHNSWGTKFCLPETNSFAPLAGCNYPPIQESRGKQSSFRCGCFREQITAPPKKGRNLPGVPERVHEVNMQLTTFSGHQLDAKNSSRTRNTPKKSHHISSCCVSFLFLL